MDCFFFLGNIHSGSVRIGKDLEKSEKHKESSPEASTASASRVAS